MSIQVRFFASLREQMGKAEETLDAEDIVTAADVWARVSGRAEWPANTRVAVNLEYAEPNYRVKDGDEVAFFPPVTGG